MEVLSAWLAGELPAPLICATLDFSLASAKPGRVSFTGSPAAWLYNPIGSVHGGWLATLLDSAMGCAVYSELPAHTAWSTIDIDVRFIRPVTADTGAITVSGRVEHRRRRTATASARATGARGRLVASATTDCVFTPDPTWPTGQQDMAARNRLVERSLLIGQRAVICTGYIVRTARTLALAGNSDTSTQSTP